MSPLATLGGRPICIVANVTNCGDDPSQIAAWLDAALERDGLADAELEYDLSVVRGATGPRCKPEASPCWPERAARALVKYDPESLRCPLSSGVAGSACEHDGDCVITRCGSSCSAWSEAAPGETCAESGPEPPASFCGCIAGGCTWFNQ